MSAIARACLASSLALAACSVRPVRTNERAEDRPVRRERVFDHGSLATLLERHVDEDGLVDYRGLAKDRAVLDGYLEGLAEVDPNSLVSPAETKAYWLNAYNAAVLFGVVHYEATDTAALRGFFTGVRTRCGGYWWSLEEMRDRVLRPLGDPRVHFALCNAWRGGPKLRREPYAAARLDRQLDEQAREFLADTRKNTIDDREKRVVLTEPFRTFEDDFAVAPYHGLHGFVRKFTLPREWLAGDFPIEWRPCDTSLNGQAGR